MASDIDIDSGRASLSDNAFNKLRDMIVNHQLKAGDILVESRLASSLQLTRTPLREAMVRLEGAGLLVKQKGHSFAVRQVSITEYFQSLKVRQYLETKAAVLALDKIKPDDINHFRERIEDLSTEEIHGPAHWLLDNDLHSWLAHAGGNNVLAESILRLRTTTQLFEIGRPFDRTTADAEEHLAILDALADGTPRAVESAVLQHLRNIEKDVLKIVAT